MQFEFELLVLFCILELLYQIYLFSISHTGPSAASEILCVL